jgi:hypothetical protein
VFGTFFETFTCILYSFASISNVEVKMVNVITITMQKAHAKSSAVQDRPPTNAKVGPGAAMKE